MGSQDHQARDHSEDFEGRDQEGSLVWVTSYNDQRWSLEEELQLQTINEGKKNHNIICFNCKEKGHNSRNCHKKPTTREGGGNGGDGKGGGKDKSQITNPYKMKPKDGESKIKTINNGEGT